MHACTIEKLALRLVLFLMLGLFASGCAFGGRAGIGMNPSEVGELSSYQVRLASEMGNDRTGGVVLSQEFRAGVGSLGMGIGLKVPVYIETEERTYYVAPAAGVTGGMVNQEDRSGLDLRLGIGLADRRRKPGGALKSLFSWSYDTRTIGLEVSQVVTLD